MREGESPHVTYRETEAGAHLRSYIHIHAKVPDALFLMSSPLPFHQPLFQPSSQTSHNHFSPSEPPLFPHMPPALCLSVYSSFLNSSFGVHTVISTFRSQGCHMQLQGLDGPLLILTCSQQPLTSMWLVSDCFPHHTATSSPAPWRYCLCSSCCPQVMPVPGLCSHCWSHTFSLSPSLPVALFSPLGPNIHAVLLDPDP